MDCIQSWEPQRSEVITVGQWESVSLEIQSNNARAFVQLNTVWREVKDVSFYTNADNEHCLIYFATVKDTVFSHNGGLVAVPPTDYCNMVAKNTPLMVAYRHKKEITV